MTWIDLPGTANLRDVGGLVTSDGRTVRSGRLLRSANLEQLDDQALARLRDELGVSDVIDLRSDSERAKAGPPRALAAGIRVHPLDLHQPMPKHLVGTLLPWQHEPGEGDLADLYLTYLDRPDSLLAALRVIAGAPGATLVHCAAGKDRTGTVVGIALLTVGVPRDTVVADYALSNERLDEVTELLLRDPVYAVNPVTGRPVRAAATPGSMLEAFFDRIDARHGSLAQWLGSQGWTSADTEALKHSLT
ncbi:MAG: tyrosine-protein phosphatase [Actinomycetia bacterium]|nr:tyrosine-protein phosphatase [Actinomycetes bacterium]